MTRGKHELCRRVVPELKEASEAGSKLPEFSLPAEASVSSFYGVFVATVVGDSGKSKPLDFVPQVLKRMAEKNSLQHTAAELSADANSKSWLNAWRQCLRWSPTSKEDTVQSEKRLLTSLVKTPYIQQQVNIGSGAPGARVHWFRSQSSEDRFINTVTFDKGAPDTPTLVMVHGYGAAQGFFFRNFDALAEKFRVHAIDQIGYKVVLIQSSILIGVGTAFVIVKRLRWGASSRPDFTCKSTEETESWFVDSLEEWRKEMKLGKFILLGHSLGGYVAARYALKHPENVEHLILVGSAGFSSELDQRVLEFRSTWKGAFINYLWESNVTPQKFVRFIGPWGPQIVRGYTGARFGTRAVGTVLDDNESKLLSDYIFHTLAARPSGEYCLKYIFAFGAAARLPLTQSAPDWKVPTSFIYGTEDWMDWKGAQKASELMNVPTEIIRVPQGGHFVFMDNARDFHSAVFYACRKFLATARTSGSLSEDVVNHLSPFVYPEKGILMKFTLACLILLSSAAV
ncbi:hypothetical protein AXG93_4421s1360 [Marchantia polymorpha subsp. ruderalis]|uniref:AB hydrolase-1 domain-containing protein n=1 Tax=Marchantia polymorpha subsp. ruderalis TaxID=1480154 RepID=A0A176WHA3_MARPO|nr:hypothetical protein AXG93_4421s1360 [Marchantia polymorpha subsp. ruderalis]